MDKENEMAIKNSEENHDSNKNKKKKFKLKLTKDLINEVKIKFKEIEKNRASEELRNQIKKDKKEENSRDFNSSENSHSNSREEKESRKKKGKNLNKSTISNIENKDPLDDIKYLHNIRVNEKELYRENSMMEE